MRLPNWVSSSGVTPVKVLAGAPDAFVRKWLNEAVVELRTGVGDEAIGFDTKAFAVADGAHVIAAERFLDFAFSEDGTQLGRDGMPEIVGVVFACQVSGHR